MRTAFLTWLALSMGCALPGSMAPGADSSGTSRTGCVPIPGGVLDDGGGQRVEIAAYCLEATEVTVRQYDECVQAGACSGELELGQKDDGWCETPLPGCQRRKQRTCNSSFSDRDGFPVNCVDLGQAQAYCSWQGRRLPTGAEQRWEIVGGAEGRTWPWGESEPTCSTMSTWQNDCPLLRGPTAPVGAAPQGRSVHGIYDLVGNVSEWVTDPQERVSEVRSARIGFRCAESRAP